MKKLPIVLAIFLALTSGVLAFTQQQVGKNGFVKSTQEVFDKAIEGRAVAPKDNEISKALAMVTYTIDNAGALAIVWEKELPDLTVFEGALVRVTPFDAAGTPLGETRYGTLHIKLPAKRNLQIPLHSMQHAKGATVDFLPANNETFVSWKAIFRTER